MKATKETIIAALRAFVAQRPGFEPANYAGSPAGYRADSRRATADRRDAEEMLRAIAWRDSLTADDLRRALSVGRLTWTEDGNGGGELDYTAGQYWCVEYRAAVCRALSNALWDYWRDGNTNGVTLDRIAKRELGASVARRWFS